MPKYKIKIELTAEEDAKVYYEKTLGKNKTIRKRAEILYYASRGTESMEELSRITGIHRDSVKRTLDGYHAEGIEYIYRCARGKRRNHLDEKAEEVKALVRNRRPETVSVFLAMIAEELDIHLTETPARRWLKKMGFVTLKQEEFRKKQT